MKELLVIVVQKTKVGTYRAGTYLSQNGSKPKQAFSKTLAGAVKNLAEKL